MEKNLRQTILERLRGFSTPGRPVYLVGGAVRDLLLNRPVHDLDFAVPGPTRKLAQEVACQLNAALYVMDEERDTTRVVLEPGSHERVLLDFATLRAADLEGDLRARDFTINAIAQDLAQPDKLIDPTGGSVDLREKRIRACSPDSLNDDPVRVLRGIRQALAFQFRIDADTLRQMRSAVPRLLNTSAERLRDELFRILDGPQVSLAIRLLDQLGALGKLLPEMEALKGIPQSVPHQGDVWEHTINTLSYLEQLYVPLVGQYNEKSVSDLTVGSAVLWLGRFRKQFEAHYNQNLVMDRSLRSLLFLAALYHDIARPEIRPAKGADRAHFLEHPGLGMRIAARRARELALSAAEVQRLETIITHQLRVHFLTGSLIQGQAQDHGDFIAHGHPFAGGEGPSRRAIYRFFKDTGLAGVDICLLSLADLRGTYGVTLPQALWEAELQTCRNLLEAYWENNEKVVSPPKLVSGEDLMSELGLKPGRLVGKMLSLIREAQAAGEITNRAEALESARQWVERLRQGAPGGPQDRNVDNGV